MATLTKLDVADLEFGRRLDPEYYRPAIRDLARELSFTAIPLKVMAKRITQGPNPQFTEAGVPCLNGRNIAAGRLNIDKPNYVSPDEYEDLSRFHLRAGDILVTLKGLGSIGQVAFVPTDLKAVFSRDIGLIRIDPAAGFLPEYVFACLSSPVGRSLMDRGSTGGTGQMTLSMTYLSELPIPSASNIAQAHVAQLVRGGLDSFQTAGRVYAEGCALMLAELGWDRFDLAQPEWWETNREQAVARHRIDADHFQPKYSALARELTARGARPLADFAESIRRGVQPKYDDGGGVMVVNSQHIGPYLPAVDATARTTAEFWERKRKSRIEKGDALIYSTGAHVGRSNVWLEDEQAVASNHVTIVRANGCNPSWLAVYLNSPPGRMQADQWACGSAQRELYPDAVGRILVCPPSATVQDQVARFAESAHSEDRLGRSLFDRAAGAAEKVYKKNALRGRVPKGEDEREQRETWTFLRKAVDEDRLSGRKFFP